MALHLNRIINDLFNRWENGIKKKQKEKCKKNKINVPVLSSKKKNLIKRLILKHKRKKS